MRFSFFSVVSLVVLVGCVHTMDKFAQVHPGQSRAQVIALLGNPEDRSFHEGNETWSYQMYNGATGGMATKLITFKGDQVISLSNDVIAEQRAHEIRHAEAGATRINIGGIGGVNNPNRRWACGHHNAFGNYPTGGGCNAFGCWGPGGSCNAFGCSFSGACTATSCPNKYKRLSCN